MLVSFHESYTILIQLCTLFCVLVLIYNFGNFLTKGLREKIQERKTIELINIITNYTDMIKKNSLKVDNRLHAVLTTSNGLISLSNALDRLEIKSFKYGNFKIKSSVNKILLDLYDKKHKKMDDSVHELLISLLKRCDAPLIEIKDALINNLNSKNLLLKIETLGYISSQGDLDLMIRALDKINNEALIFNNKLLTDILIKYKGNHYALVEKIWDNFNYYSEDIQVSFIQMLTVLKDETFDQRLYKLMDNTNSNKEIRIASMKYFKSVVRPNYIYRLAKFIDDPVWEYGAVAAIVLRSYDCTKVFKDLLNGCRSQNWHVRNNSANTLVACCDKKQIKQAMKIDDRYARESIMYVVHRFEKEGKKV